MKQRLAAQLASLVGVFVVWLLVSMYVGADVIPRPWSTASTTWSMVTDGDVTSPLLGSLARTLGGFCGAMICGTAYGIAAARSRTFRAYTIGLYSIVFFAPTLVVIFLGLLTFGFNSSAVVILIATFATFANVGVYIRDVMGHVDDELLLMAKSYNASIPDRVVHIYLPYLVPPLLSSSRIALNSAWKIVLLCEVFGFPGGLGFSLRNAYASYDLPHLFGWIVVIVVTLLVVEQAIRLIEATVVRWR